MGRLPSTKQQVLTSGTNLLTIAGLNGITIGALAVRTGMSKSGLFAHFRSKEELQLQLLDNAAQIASATVIEPAMAAAPGLPRLRALVAAWLGWTRSAGLDGGCPVAAGMFELDDMHGHVRDHLLSMEAYWRALLLRLTDEAVERKQLKKDLDAEQFVWELCGIYLSHHASSRFLNDPKADVRAGIAFEALLARSAVNPRSKL